MTVITRSGWITRGALVAAVALVSAAATAADDPFARIKKLEGTWMVVDEVQLTHYCAGGHQPRLRLVATPKPGVVQMEFVDITNMVTMNDEHMHEGQFQWVDDNHLKTEWRSFKNGRFTDAMRFEMVRRP